MLWSWKKIGPMTGTSASSGTVTFGSSEVAPALDRPSPRTRARPVPSSVRDSPDTIWSAWKWIVTTAWRRLRAAPASIAIATPSHGLPVATTVAKPATAPMSIIPSTPRFTTPARSAKISPSAAKNRTVPVPMPAARITTGSMLRLLAAG